MDTKTFTTMDNLSLAQRTAFLLLTEWTFENDISYTWFKGNLEYWGIDESAEVHRTWICLGGCMTVKFILVRRWKTLSKHWSTLFFLSSKFGHGQASIACLPFTSIAIILHNSMMSSSIYKIQLVKVIILVRCREMGSWFLFVYNIE